jgi:hypothetical protein
MINPNTYITKINDFLLYDLKISLQLMETRRIVIDNVEEHKK